jgi:hypothetical protein
MILKPNILVEQVARNHVSRTLVRKPRIAKQVGRLLEGRTTGSDSSSSGGGSRLVRILSPLELRLLLVRARRVLASAGALLARSGHGSRGGGRDGHPGRSGPAGRRRGGQEAAQARRGTLVVVVQAAAAVVVRVVFVPSL